MLDSRKGRVKLQDIAQASGVSLTAVSLALSEKPGISPETRMRVLEVAHSLGYRFKSPASATPQKSIKTIGLLVKAGSEDEPHANHFYSYIIAGIEATCRQMGLNLMYANLPVDHENYPTEIPLLLENGDVDGILVVGVFIDEAMSHILDSRACPVVLVDSYCPTRLYNSVLSDNHQGAYQATEYLLCRGHRHIGFVGGHEKAYPSFDDRRAGYQKALADYEIPHMYFADCVATRGEAASAAVKLVRQNPQITAVMGVNDDIAIASMYALIEAGYRIPHDISITGFDDIYIAESVVPSLTTMRVNKQGMGKLAVQLLLNHVPQAEADCVTSVFRPTLVERNSVVSAPRSPGSGPKK